MIAPHQGPRELLIKKPLTSAQKKAIRGATEQLEAVQFDMYKHTGDSIERTKICRVLETLYGLPVAEKRLLIIDLGHRCVEMDLPREPREWEQHARMLLHMPPSEAWPKVWTAIGDMMWRNAKRRGDR